MRNIDDMMKTLVPDRVDKIIVKIMTDIGYKIDYQPELEIGETSKIAKDYDAVIVRSYKLHDVPIEGNIKAIGRVGARVNVVPLGVRTFSDGGQFS